MVQIQGSFSPAVRRTSYPFFYRIFFIFSCELLRVMPFSIPENKQFLSHCNPDVVSLTFKILRDIQMNLRYYKAKYMCIDGYNPLLCSDFK